MSEYIVTILIKGTHWGHVTITEAELLNIGIRDTVEDKYGIGTEFKVCSVGLRSE